MQKSKIKNSNNRGKFIVFEGLDGSGQSTQISLLEKYLKAKAKKVHTTTEPTNNIIGGLIRGVLTKQWKISNIGLQLLYGADRAHHLESEITPAMQAGNIVVSSRYYFSTFAFGSLNTDLGWLQKINEKFPAPDITFFIRVSPKECMRRISESRFEKELFEKEKKLEKIIKVYDKISRSKKFKNFHVINGEHPKRKVHQDIIKILNKNLSL